MPKVLIPTARKVKVDVQLKAGQQLIITSRGETVVKGNSNTYGAALWSRWIDACKEQNVPRDMWPSKWAPREDYSPIQKVPVEWKPIADMHTAQLVRSIKWCISQACYWMTKAARGLGPRVWTMTLPEILAQSPQWSGLLVEAEKRKLDIVCFDSATFSQWYEECKKAAVLKALQS